MSKGWVEALCAIGCIIGGCLTGYVVFRIKKRKNSKSQGVYPVVVAIVWILIFGALKLIFRF